MAFLGKLAVTMQTMSPPPRPAASTDPGAPGARTSGSAGFYRYDLDGVRGIAIALVAVFHIWFGRVSGGVDVFLALSGFFFGGKILRAALNPAVSLSPVAEVIRLIRRLVPALVVVLAGCAVLTIVVQPQTRWETFADQSLASLGYYQNWELANTASDYLRAGEAVSPLQHIWSMSVQGQFYVAFLLLIAGCAVLFRRPLTTRLRTLFVALLSILTVASFVYAVFAHSDDQSIAYYDSFARGWELLLGALVGALVAHIRWPMWLRTTVASVALAAIVSCGALIDGVNEFPGPWALVPVGATMLMILAGANLQGRSRHSDAAAQPAAGHPAPGGAGRHRLLAVPVALAAAHLLAVLHRPQTRQLRRRCGGAAGLRGAGLPDQPARRGPAALPGTAGIRTDNSRPGPAVAVAVAPADDGNGFSDRVAGRHADRDLVHLASARHGVAGRGQGTQRAQPAGLSRRPRPDRTRAGADAADAAQRPGGEGGPARLDARRLHQ